MHRQNLFAKVFLFLLLATFTPLSQSLTLKNSDQSTNLARYVQFFEDKTGNLTFDQISSKEFDNRFQKKGNLGEDLNFGFSNSTYWIKITLNVEENTQSAFLLEISRHNIDYIDFFAPDQPPILTGNFQSYEKRPLAGKDFIFPITLDNTPTFIQALYFGGLLALILYNLLIYFSLKDNSYLLYSLFAVFMGLGQFAGNNFGRMYFWPNSPSWDSISRTTFLCFAGLFALLFSQSFLRTKIYTPKLHRTMRVAAITFGSIAILLVSSINLGFETKSLFKLFFILCIIAAILFIYAGAITLIIGRPEAKYYLIAWGVFSTGIIIGSLRVFNLIPSLPFTTYIVQITSAFEMVLLSFALAHRLYIQQVEKSTAQSEALKTKQLLVEHLQESERKLALTVKERTNALETSLFNQQKFHDQYVRFSAFISHEFRSPLGIVESQVSLLKRELEHGLEFSKARFNTINSAIQRLAELFERWLQSDKVNQTLNRIHASNLALEPWLKDILLEFKQLHPGHKITLEVPTGLIIFADSQLLKTVISNLIDNACKYSPTGSTVLIKANQEIDATVVRVFDEGCGIDRNLHDEIFKEYFRVNSNSDARGLGLGLPFVKRIMDLHHGWIEVNSEPNSGSIFSAYFPHKQDS